MQGQSVDGNWSVVNVKLMLVIIVIVIVNVELVLIKLISNHIKGLIQPRWLVCMLPAPLYLFTFHIQVYSHFISTHLQCFSYFFCITQKGSPTSALENLATHNVFC